MAPYHILIVIISSVIPENLVLLTKSEQSGPKSAHIRPTISNPTNFVDFNQLSCTELVIKLMNSRNFPVNSHLLKFVSLCND